MNNILQLKKMDREASLLSHGIAVLSWDQETVMPDKAIKERSEQISLFEGILHEKLTDDRWGELFSKLSVNNDSLPTDLDQTDIAFLRKAYRRYERKMKIPVDLVSKLSGEISMSQSIWVKAKEGDDYASFVPHLEKLIDYSRTIADLVGYDESPYDALLDEYEPSMRSSELKRVFDNLEPGLRDLINRIGAAPQVDCSFLDQDFPVKLQDEMGRKLQKDMGYDFNRGRLDLTEHPFTTTLGFNDVRVTTHYHCNDLLSGIFSNIHEAGHGQYEQGFAENLRGSLLADGASMGIHESQSRFWENIVGRDIHYWAYYYPELVKLFPHQLQAVSLSDFYKAINRVEPSFVRIEADEVTYSMHIILRYRIEEALISGNLTVKDLPDAWAAESEKLLGITPQTNSKGVLQDIHWAVGLFGYFPTYALGNLYGAQFQHAMKSEMKDYDQNLLTGNLKPLEIWLNNNIHQYGATFTASELVKNITGEKLNSKYFLNYLNDKYKTVYDI